jgi:hypothetical protein
LILHNNPDGIRITGHVRTPPKPGLDYNDRSIQTSIRAERGVPDMHSSVPIVSNTLPLPVRPLRSSDSRPCSQSKSSSVNQDTFSTHLAYQRFSHLEVNGAKRTEALNTCTRLPTFTLKCPDRIRIEGEANPTHINLQTTNPTLKSTLTRERDGEREKFVKI